MDGEFGKLKYLINKGYKIDEICTKMNLPKYYVIGMVITLKEKGFGVDYIDGRVTKTKMPKKIQCIYKVDNLSGDNIRLCLISDTHLCSIYDRLDILNYIYEKAYKNGIKIILHDGDFTDGNNGTEKHVSELKEESYSGQVDYCVEKYPFDEDIKTYAIQGNHDDWWYQKNGEEILKSISDQRSDIIYLGRNRAILQLGKLAIGLFHGKGNTRQIQNYQVAKDIKKEFGNKVLNLLILGHVHQSFYINQSDVHCFQAGCLMDKPPYFYDGTCDTSCWWIDINLDSKGNIYDIRMNLEHFNKNNNNRYVRQRMK